MGIDWSVEFRGYLVARARVRSIVGQGWQRREGLLAGRTYELCAYVFRRAENVKEVFSMHSCEIMETKALVAPSAGHEISEFF